jgi:hypothetical protein
MRWLPLLLFVAACGGGGGGSEPLPLLEQQASFGIVRADAQTQLDIVIPNPFEGDATAEDMGGPGGRSRPRRARCPPTCSRART